MRVKRTQGIAIGTGKIRPPLGYEIIAIKGEKSLTGEPINGFAACPCCPVALKLDTFAFEGHSKTLGIAGSFSIAFRVSKHRIHLIIPAPKEFVVLLLPVLIMNYLSASLATLRFSDLPSSREVHNGHVFRCRAGENGQ